MSPNQRRLRWPFCSQSFTVARWCELDCESIPTKKKLSYAIFWCVSIGSSDHRLLHSSSFSCLIVFPSMSLLVLKGKTSKQRLQVAAKIGGKSHGMKLWTHLHFDCVLFATPALLSSPQVLSKKCYFTICEVLWIFFPHHSDSKGKMSSVCVRQHKLLGDLENERHRVFKRTGARVCGGTWYILALVLIFRHLYLLHIETFTSESHGSAWRPYIVQQGPSQPPSIL